MLLRLMKAKHSFITGRHSATARLKLDIGGICHFLIFLISAINAFTLSITVIQSFVWDHDIHRDHRYH